MSDQTRHTLSVAISEDYTHLDVRCHEGVNAPCRRTCVKECEKTCSDPDKHVEDTGECGAVEWINADSVDEHYVGEKRPIRDGMPIEVDWTGENWVWSIPELDIAEQAGVIGTAMTTALASGDPINVRI